VLENERLCAQGKITQAECEVEIGKVEDGGTLLAIQWVMESQRRADKAIEQAEIGDVLEEINEGKPHTFDVKGLSGVEILGLCGVKKPFAAQRERKKISRIRRKLFDNDFLSKDEDDAWETRALNGLWINPIHVIIHVNSSIQSRVWICNLRSCTLHYITL